MKNRTNICCRQKALVHKSTISLLMIVALLLFCPVEGGAIFFFEKIADTKTDIPGHKGWVPSFWDFLLSPATDSGNVAFVGSGIDFLGIIIDDGNGLQCVVDDKTSVPNKSNVKFKYFWPPSISGTKVAFIGFRPGNPTFSNYGVYTNAWGPLMTVVDKDTPIPGSTNKFNFPPLNFLISFENANVVFTGGHAKNKTNYDTIDEYGIYRAKGSGPLIALAHNGYVAPGTSGSAFSLFAMPSLSYDNVAFLGVYQSPGGVGVYHTISGINTIYKIADLNTLMPGGNGATFGDFGALSSSGFFVSFIGCKASDCGVYFYNWGVINPYLSKLVDTNTTVPGGGSKFTNFSVLSIDGKKVAFSGRSSKEEGIYLYNIVDSSLDRVIKRGDVLGNKTVESLDFGPEGFSGYDIVFRAEFKNTGTPPTPQGIYRAQGPIVSFSSGDVLVQVGSKPWVPIPCTLCVENITLGHPFVFDIKLDVSGLGVDAPLWFEPIHQETYEAAGFEYEVEGTAFESITLPEDIGSWDWFKLFLSDSDSGNFSDSGITLSGGDTYYFEDSGMTQFKLIGVTQGVDELDGSPDPSAVLPMGFTFVDNDTMVEVRITPAITYQPVSIDIKPNACPNTVFLKRNGAGSRRKLTVAILGSEDFDVRTIDPDSVRIVRDGTRGEAIPIHHDYEDVSATLETDDICECNSQRGDGYEDLTLRFPQQQLSAALDLHDLAGHTIFLTVVGNIKAEAGGMAIRGQDCMRIRKRNHRKQQGQAESAGKGNRLSVLFPSSVKGVAPR